MALTDNGSGNVGTVMPVSPMYGGNGGGFGGFGGDWASLIVLFLIFGMFNGGWGNGYGGNGADGMFPWLISGQNGVTSAVNSGFDNAAVASQLSGIQTSLTTGFSNAEVAGCNRAMDAIQTAYANEIANLERSFASQTANTQGFTNLASQLANCCCENRLATANLGADIAREACADRAAVSDALNATLNTMNAGIQSIKDQLCSDKIDAKNEKITELQNQLTMAQLAANNNLQTQTLLADNLAQTNALEQYLAPVPRPAYIVQNPACCNQQTGCGCGF